jgi:hypothetical protein
MPLRWTISTLRGNSYVATFTCYRFLFFAYLNGIFVKFCCCCMPVARMIVAQFVMEMMHTREWFRELGN